MRKEAYAYGIKDFASYTYRLVGKNVASLGVVAMSGSCRMQLTPNAKSSATWPAACPARTLCS